MSEMAAADPELEIIDLTGETTTSEDGESGDEDEERDKLRYTSSGLGPDAASRAQLHAAVNALPEARLRQMVLDLADTVPAVYHALARGLLTVGSTSRVIPRWEMCANCGETYDVYDDANELCLFHPGELKADETKFVDWDEDCHGPVDTPENRDEYPDNFSWTCCNGDATAPGCVTGRHRPAAPQTKKQRV
ncbi:hypothetical protein GGX14DRAFT_493576 [Mycena pura]|uniref:Uncharacterized protein n=1 Tax=Mycena pura TaxID=153505 RepID=A0AAD6YKH5_9AGAR|nr:hypothetical protein GGX14DRAFT_493576 [Mycena pura]